MLASCAPVNNITDYKNDKTDKKHTVVSNEISPKTETVQDTIKLEEKILEKKPLFITPDESLQNNITIILSKKDRPEILNQFINIIELAVYQKKIHRIVLVVLCV